MDVCLLSCTEYMKMIAHPFESNDPNLRMKTGAYGDNVHRHLKLCVASEENRMVLRRIEVPARTEIRKGDRANPFSIIEVVHSFLWFRHRSAEIVSFRRPNPVPDTNQSKMCQIEDNGAKSCSRPSSALPRRYTSAGTSPSCGGRRGHPSPQRAGLSATGKGIRTGCWRCGLRPYS